MKCGLIKKSNISISFCFMLALFFFVLFGLFNIKSVFAVDITTLTPVLDLSSPSAYTSYVQANLPNCSTSVVGSGLSGGTGYSTTTNYQNIQSIQFHPKSNLTFDSIGLNINYVPSSSQSQLQLAVYRLNDWNLKTGAMPRQVATSTSMTLVGLSKFIATSTSFTTANQSVFYFVNPITLYTTYHYLIVALPFPSYQNPYYSGSLQLGVSTFTSGSQSFTCSDDTFDFLSLANIRTATSSGSTYSENGVSLGGAFYFQFLPFTPSSSIYQITTNTVGNIGTIPIGFYISNTVSYCFDTSAINYGGSLPCLYNLNTYNATSTSILSWSFSTTTSKTNASYFVSSADVPVIVEVIELNTRDGVIADVFGTTTAGLYSGSGEVIIPDDVANSGITTLTLKLLSGDKTKIFASRSIFVDLSTTEQIGDSGSGSENACYTTCTPLNLGGCVQNAIAYLFCPSQGSLDLYRNLVDTIQLKPPIGYFTVVKNNLTSISSSTAPTFTIIIPSSLKTYIFNPFQTAIASILWFFFAIHFYKRLKTITI